MEEMDDIPSTKKWTSKQHLTQYVCSRNFQGDSVFSEKYFAILLN